VAGDEVVVTKAGKQTFGLDRFYSGLLQKTVPGLDFFALALVSPIDHCADPVAIEQTVRTTEEKAAAQAKRQAWQAHRGTRKPGRPKGSKNKNKAKSTLTPELQRIQAMLQGVLRWVAGRGGCPSRTWSWMVILATTMPSRWFGSAGYS
jgi:hypothetical protein